jgi:hypothetical protein
MNDNIQQEDAPGQEWDAYEAVTETLVENEITNGDLIFVIAVLLAELVKQDDFDFDELFQNIKEMTLTNVKIMSDA